MTARRFIYALFLLLFLTGCGGNEFFIDFSLPEKTEANYEVTYYARDKKGGGATVQAVAPVMDGIYHFRGVTIKPTLLYISNKSFKEPTVIYAEKGKKIKITGESTSPYSWKIEGAGDINTKLSEWRNEFADTLARGIPQEINEAVSAFVKKNPEEPAAAIILFTHFDRGADNNLFMELWYSLKGKAKEKKWKDITARADFMTGAPKPAARLKSMVLRSAKGRIDTLRTGGKHASIIYFWDNSSEHRKAILDSINNISYEFKADSLKLVADISLEPDSMSWRNQIKRDTLDNIMLRLWEPQGIARKEFIKLGVNEVPLFMVIDGEGKQIYKGEEADSAFDSFRTLMKSHR